MIMARLKTGESRNTRHIANCEGTYVALHVQRRPLDWSARRMPKCCTMLRKMWPALPDSVLQEAPLGYKDGSVWALVEIGGTYTKTCCQKKPCPHPCDARPGDAWCPERRDICVACRSRSISLKDKKEKWIGYAGAGAGGRQPKLKRSRGGGATVE